MTEQRPEPVSQDLADRLYQASSDEDRFGVYLAMELRGVGSSREVEEQNIRTWGRSLVDDVNRTIERVGDYGQFGFTGGTLGSRAASLDEHLVRLRDLVERERRLEDLAEIYLEGKE